MIVVELDITDSAGCARLLAGIRPDELYNLAGLSGVSGSFNDPTAAWATNADAVQRLFEAVRTQSPVIRFYQSSSTEMFGARPDGAVTHDEDSVFLPLSPYATAKASAHLVCDAYRRACATRVAAGILSNHESRRRPSGFLTRRVVDHVSAVRVMGRAGLRQARPLALGNLSAERDCGFAPDYAEAIVRVIRQIEVRARTLGEAPEASVGSNHRDYVLGSGRLHAVWQLVDRAFALAGLDLEWDRSSTDPADWVATFRASGSLALVVDRSLFRRTDPAAIRADSSLAERELGWKARPDLDRSLRNMLESTAGDVAEGV